MGPASTTQAVVLTLALALAGALLTTVVAPSAAWAGDEDITVVVRTIRAETTAAPQDPKLNDIGERLTKAFRDYGAFTEIANHRVTLGSGQSSEFVLPDSHKLTVNYVGLSEAFMKLRLKIDTKFKSEIRMSDGGTVFQAGLPYGKGGMLIIAITVQGGEHSD